MTKEVTQNSYTNEENSFRVELLNCAKLLNLFDHGYDDTEFITPLGDYKSKQTSLYIEEPLIANKRNQVVKQDVPSNVSEILQLMVDDEENEINLKIKKDQPLPEESGIRAPLEMLNEWGASGLLFDLEEMVSANYKEFEDSIDNLTRFEEVLRL
ncbi:6352_t:CDS:2, partial [Acaulospora colombiana]